MGKNTKYTIALDLDGTISDFEGAICSYLKIRNISEISKGKLWATVDRMNKELPFFENLPLMSDGLELFQFVNNHYNDIFILSAKGTSPVDAGEQKVAWVRKHLCPNIKVVCVLKSPNKAEYASATTILIDDRMKSIDPWVKAGGIGILHRNTKDTIIQLKRYL